MKIRKKYGKDLKHCVLKSDKYRATVTRTHIMLSRKDDAGKWQPVEDRQTVMPQGLTANVAEAERLLELQSEADKARQDRIKVLQDGMTSESLIADPVGTLAASRELETLGAEVQVEAPPKNTGDGSFDDLLKNPAHSVSQARNQERE